MQFAYILSGSVRTTGSTHFIEFAIAYIMLFDDCLVIDHDSLLVYNSSMGYTILEHYV